MFEKKKIKWWEWKLTDRNSAAPATMNQKFARLVPQYRSLPRQLTTALWHDTAKFQRTRCEVAGGSRLACIRSCRRRRATGDAHKYACLMTSLATVGNLCPMPFPFRGRIAIKSRRSYMNPRRTTKPHSEIVCCSHHAETDDSATRDHYMWLGGRPVYDAKLPPTLQQVAPGNGRQCACAGVKEKFIGY